MLARNIKMATRITGSKNQFSSIRSFSSAAASTPLCFQISKHTVLGNAKLNPIKFEKLREMVDLDKDFD